MMRIALIASVSASLLAACSTAVPPAPEVVRQDAAPRPTLTSVMVEGVAVRTLADEVSALDLARAASDEA
ncbi:MAG: hypothetical protein HRU11_07140, partial [Parvularculaceae bacterium]|nr:hypothetical protein [Parvularculaceae bacterium]